MSVRFGAVGLGMELPTYFESLLQRSPISPNDITVFLREMRRTPSGPLITSKLLAGKIQSTSEANALRAFEFLEAALEVEVEGSIEFRTEVGRYRFLNEIIRVLSPKYLGDQTSSAVKERAVRFLTDAAGCKRRKWFPSAHSKIDAVYVSLVESGIIQKEAEDPSSFDPDAEFKKNIFERGENAVLLKKLLQSKNPADLQAANRLIKNLVDEEAKRNERRTELHSLIDRIDTSTTLLTEMLEQSRIDKEIVDELAATCQSLRNKLGGIGAETNEETTSLLQASDNIEKALELYEIRKNGLAIGEGDSPERETQEPSGAIGNSTAIFSLADELLMGMDLGLPLEPVKEIGAGDRGICTTDNLLNLDIDLGNGSKCEKDELKEAAVAKNLVFDEISRMSRELMDKNLIGIEPSNSALISDLKSRTSKVPMSQLRRNSENIAEEAARQNSSTNSQFSLLDLDFLEKSENSKPTPTPSPQNQKPSFTKRANSSTEDENLLLVLEKGNTTNHPQTENSVSVKKQSPTHPEEPELVVKKENEKIQKSQNVTPNFVLSSVKELDMERIELEESLSPLRISVDDEKGVIGLTLTFGSFPDFPSSVKVAVISVTNQSSTSSFLNYVFQLMPPKGVQVKLLPPSCTELPPWKKRFLPPPVLTQVALILVPTISKSRLKYILSYCLEDETALQNGDFELPVY